MDYDVIGDIHGQFGKLEALLGRLGYRERQGAWRHPERSAIFVGDFIDRGPHGVETVRAVRAMVDAGSALAVMGNHELNAAAWHTPDPRNPGEYLRPRWQQPWGAKNRKQHLAFLDQVESAPALHAELVAWFLTLPLWIDLDELRVVHACWHAPAIAWLSPRLHDGGYLTPELLVEATTEPVDAARRDDFSIFSAVETLTKGLEIALPAPHGFFDKDGIRRTQVRQRWWDRDAVTYRAAAMLPPEDRAALPDTALPEQHLRAAGADGGKPTFFGHYWMTGTPRPQSGSAVCVDYSAGNGGPLVAYRWRKGEPLDARHFVTTDG